MVYTPLLSRWLGVAGVAWANVLLMNSSFAWQIVLHEYRLRSYPAKSVLKPFAIVTAAAAAGLAGPFATGGIGAPIGRLIAGGLSGLGIYAAALYLMGLIRRGKDGFFVDWEGG
jgi:hypothetical protein